MKFNTMEEFADSIKQCIAEDEDGEYFGYSDIFDNLNLILENFDSLSDYLEPSELSDFLAALGLPNMPYSSEVEKFAKACIQDIATDKSPDGQDLNYLNPFNYSGVNDKNSNKVIFVSFVMLDKNTNKQLQSFPVECLPDEIKLYVNAVSESLQVPPDMIASFVFSTLSLCIQGKYMIEVKPDWMETLNLYVLVVARPSERKSPALREVIRPIFDYTKKENERRQPEIAEYELKKRILSGKMKDIQDKLSKPGSKAKYTFQDALDCQSELDKLEEVKKLQMVLDDVTPEALAKIMKENNERIGIISAEGGIFGIMAGRYSNNTNIDLFLKGYSGEYYSSARVGSGGIELEHPLITVALAVQPQVIADIMDNKDFRGRGLLARFLYSIPNTRVGSRKYRSNPIDPVIKEDYDKLVKELLDIPDLTGFCDRIIKLSPEADKLSEQYNQWIEGQLNGELEEIEDWAGKLHGNTMRIAGILHVVKHKCDSVRIPLEETTVKSAIAIGKYYLEHSRNAFDIMGLSDSPEIKDAKYIISRLVTNDLNDKNDFITKREALRLCQRFKAADEMEPGLQVLVEHGYIAIVKESAGRGRPSEKIYINPEYLKWKEQKK